MSDWETSKKDSIKRNPVISLVHRSPVPKVLGDYPRQRFYMWIKKAIEDKARIQYPSTFRQVTSDSIRHYWGEYYVRDYWRFRYHGRSTFNKAVKYDGRTFDNSPLV